MFVYLLAIAAIQTGANGWQAFSTFVAEVKVKESNLTWGPKAMQTGANG
jgi:hypothetical protein